MHETDSVFPVPADNVMSEAPASTTSDVEDWDSKALGRPAVAWMGGSFWMWYPGMDSRGRYAIGLAVSADGEQWTRVDARPVLTPWSLGLTDVRSVFDPTVALVGGEIRLWCSTQGRRAAPEIGHAASNDGVRWKARGPQPVLRPCASAAWQRDGLVGPTVASDGVHWHMWYAAAANGRSSGIGHAVSADGVAWTPAVDGPVLVPDPDGWDSREVTDPCVLWHDGVYYLWYAGSGANPLNRIGYAVSRDGVTWTRPYERPVLEPDPHTDLEGGGVFAPAVVRTDAGFLMWYIGCVRGSDGFRGYIHLARSWDGVVWTRSIRNPVLRPGARGKYLNPA